MENELQKKSKIFYKPYKITYIRFTEEFDFRSKNLFYKEINKLEDTDEEINYQKIDEEINILYNNLYFWIIVVLLNIISFSSKI